MDGYSLDDVDGQLLALLEEDARYTATELAERVGVSDNTIHNRMARLEEEGVINGYTTAVDYESVGMEFEFLFVATARISNRRTVAENARSLTGVVEVVELMTGHRNLHIRAVGPDKASITDLASQVDNLDLEIDDEILIRDQHASALDYEEVGAVRAD